MERFYHEDWLGSTRYLTDGAGGVPAMARYDAYGKQTAGTNPSTLTDNQYAGAWGYEREPDAGLGLDYLYQRYYDPAVGRFISPDPIRWSGGLNLYGYCDGDPVGFVDPDGLSRGPVRRPPGAARNRRDSWSLGVRQRLYGLRLHVSSPTMRPPQHPLALRANATPGRMEMGPPGFTTRRDAQIQGWVLGGRQSLYCRYTQSKPLSKELAGEVIGGKTVSQILGAWLRPRVWSAAHRGAPLNGLEGARYVWENRVRAPHEIRREHLEKYLRIAELALKENPSHSLTQSLQSWRVRIILREISFRELEGKW